MVLMVIRNPTLDAFQPRGFRNLNPGNIEDGPFARRQPGYKGTDGRFAVFDSMENGLGAQSALLNSYGNRGLNTLNAIVNRYAPAADHNNTAAYSSFLSKRMGIAPDAPLDMSNPNVRRDLALAMAEHENGKDPRSFMALGSDSMPQVGGEQPQAPQGAQSISLGGQETQQPLNNIGSTLANMGASIASLDRGGTGIASLNASRVASNLAAQEQAREAQGGWKYAGQTQNGQGLMFQNSRGEIRVEPLAPGFAGNKNDETTLQKDYAWAGGDSEKQKLLNAHYGIKDKTPVSQDTIRTLGEQVLAGNYKALTRLGEDNRVAVWDYIGKKEKDLGLPSGFILQSEAEQEARKTAEREYGRMDARRNTAGNTFLAGASTLIDLSEQMPRDHYYSVNEILNFSKKQMQDPQLSRLNAAVNTAVNEYANAITTSASGATVSDKQHARELLSSAQDHESLKGALQTMTQEVVRSKENIFMSNENRRAKAKGQEVPYPQLEGEGPGGSGVPKALEEKLKPKEAASKKPKEPSGLPEVGKKANINGVEIERLE
jgi:hypothetical protein